MEKIKFVDLKKHTNNEDNAIIKNRPTASSLSIKPLSRVIINGVSGSGKTSLLMQFLVNNQIKLDYDEVILVCPSAEEDNYQFLQDYFDDIVVKEEEAKGLPEGSIEPRLKIYEKPTDLPEMKVFRDGQHRVIIFDDMVTENKATQKIIGDFFIKSRKYGFTCFYLTQYFAGVEVKCRRNSNYVITFSPGNESEAQHICRDYCPNDEIFRSALNSLKNIPYGFILIDRTTFPPKDKTGQPMRYRIGLEKNIFKSNDSFIRSSNH